MNTTPNGGVNSGKATTRGSYAAFYFIDRCLIHPAQIDTKKKEKREEGWEKKGRCLFLLATNILRENK